MTCRDFQNRLGNLVEKSLAPAKRRQAHAHLLRCADCSRFRRNYEAMVTLARAASLPDFPSAESAIPEELVQRVLAAARSKPLGSAVWGLVHLISGIAASQLIVFYLGR